MKLQPELSTIYLHREPVDFRKAVNGLTIIVEQEMELSPFDDALFIFCNKARDKLKVLYWEQTGFFLWTYGGTGSKGSVQKTVSFH